jgi:MoaA/NifB/PqqE/SkfB family radical SAM enzyme
MLKGKICDLAYFRLEIHIGGSVYHCCPSWLPVAVGNVRVQSLEDIFHSAPSQRIRASMEAGEFKYCEKTICPFLNQYLSTGQHTPPLHQMRPEELMNSFFHSKKVVLSLCYDVSCNLRCPSCRNELKLLSEDNIPADLMDVHTNTLRNVQDLLDKGYEVALNVTGSGDPFASPLYYKMLRELPAHPRLLLEIQTNGILMEEKRFTENLYANTSFLAVSVDGASKDVYEKVRLGGNFERVKTNLDWLNSAIIAGRFPKLQHYKINFIVQSENYAEMRSFAEWMLAYPSVNEIWFNVIADWGHLGSKAFAERAVWKKEHRAHADFLEKVRDPFLRGNKRINLGNLSEFL